MTPHPQPQQPLSCNTCDHYRYLVVETEGEFCQAIDEFIDNATDIIEKIGCASHSSRPSSKSVSLTAIEIALRKEDNPSENVQWAIEKLNQYQESQP